MRQRLVLISVISMLASCATTPVPATAPASKAAANDMDASCPQTADATAVAPVAPPADAQPAAAPVDAAPTDAPAVATIGTGLASATVSNDTGAPARVWISFGADSMVRASNWSSFCSASGPNCEFHLAKGASQHLPLSGNYLNATFAFDAGQICGTTKAELNINNPKWYDIADVSLVDGYSNKIKITAIEPGDAGTSTLGPPKGPTGNEKVYGLFPVGCDICVARQSPPCGIKPGGSGCKSGSQYKPDVPCQYQGSVMGGGTHFTVALVH